MSEIDWKVGLGLDVLSDAEYYSSEASTFGNPFGSSLRVGLKDLGLDAYVCLAGVPTIALASRNRFDAGEIDQLHRALWNQGLCSVLVVSAENTFRVYSLSKLPTSSSDLLAEDQRLVTTIRSTSDGLALVTFASSVRSGRFFSENKEKFQTTERVDRRLLENLIAAQAELQKVGLPSGSARALVIQTVFLAYLEDKEIVSKEYFAAAVDQSENIQSLLDVLRTRRVMDFYRLFQRLNEDLNGDIFHAPCSFSGETPSPRLTQAHLSVLFDLREGALDLQSGQRNFWPYDFKYIPVELISAIYNRFLGEDPLRRRKTGAYYTPTHLADLVINQVWEYLPDSQRASGNFSALDPACGSSIFLVRMFQRLVEKWILEHSISSERKNPPWKVLVEIARRLHGWDVEPDAVRIGIFSLYIALLEYAEPRELVVLLKQKRLLPALFDRSMKAKDFFANGESYSRKFDVVIGNPPWVSKKKESVSSAEAWCAEENLPMPGGELAWAFLWKARKHVTEDGIIGFVLPSMSVLFNHSEAAVVARKTWLSNCEVLRIVNLSDLRFQLFDGAIRPAAVCMYRSRASNSRSPLVETWSPKCSRLTSAARIISMRTSDIWRSSSIELQSNPFAWATYRWARGRDVSMLDWIRRLPSLARVATTYRSSKKAGSSSWIVGQGFGARGDVERARTLKLPELTRIPYLSTESVTPYVLASSPSQPWSTQFVNRVKFKNGFHGPRVLVPDGVRSDGRLRAAYVEKPFSFKHSVRAIKAPAGSEGQLKLLAAILNSDLCAWFLFHSSANFGAERPKVDEAQLLLVPFPGPEDLPDSEKARNAERAIVGWFDRRIAEAEEATMGREVSSSDTKEVNDLVFDYFGIDESGRSVVADTINNVIPSIQPRAGSDVVLWQKPRDELVFEYAQTLRGGLKAWLRADAKLKLSVMRGALDIAIVKVKLDGANASDTTEFREIEGRELQDELRRLQRLLPQSLSRDVELVPDLFVFDLDAVYLVKPLQLRFWMKSSALNDVDQIASYVLRDPNTSKSPIVEAA